MAGNRIIQAFKSLFARPQMANASALSPADNSRGWSVIFDHVTGAWQADSKPIDTDRVLSHWAVYACMTLIAGDIGKLRLKLVEEDEYGIWKETKSSAFSPVLRKPNHYQTTQKFLESWIFSKLGPGGNAYVLKEFDKRGVVVAMYPLDPRLVTPLISPSGMVFYRVGEDWLSHVTEEMQAVPAEYIMHDPAACLFHPLVGVSPIFANGLPATQGLNIQKDSEQFFRNLSMPGGILTAPAEISDETAGRLKKYWDDNYTGKNAGKIAVLGDGLKYESMRIKPVDAQMTEQNEQIARMICSTFHVPPFKIGIGAIPQGQKVEDLNQIYYQDCLQTLIEGIEATLDNGLNFWWSARALGTELCLDNLLKMDNATLFKVLSDGVKGGFMSPNEARLRANLPPVPGGEYPLMQQQNWQLGQLADRKAPDDKSTVQPPDSTDSQTDDQTDDESEDDDEEAMRSTEEQARAMLEAFKKGLPL